MADPSNTKLFVNLGASQVRRRLKGFGYGVCKVETAGKKKRSSSLWAVDVFSVKTVTIKGLLEMYLMAFLCLSTREVIVTSSTEHPNSAWVVEQTKVFLDQTMNREHKPSIVMHDRDTKFTKDFTATLKAKGVRTNVLPIASPNLNGRVERFIQTIKYECLFKFILFGQRPLGPHRFGVRGLLQRTTKSHGTRSFTANPGGSRGGSQTEPRSDRGSVLRRRAGAVV